MRAGDKQYYRRRLTQEFAAAQNASCDVARAVHLELAERYSAKLRLIEALSARAAYAEPQHAAA